MVSSRDVAGLPLETVKKMVASLGYQAEVVYYKPKREFGYQAADWRVIRTEEKGGTVLLLACAFFTQIN